MILLPNDKTSYPVNPGIYRMMNSIDEIIYIGKAKNLRKRLTSYFNTSTKSIRIKQMVSEIKSIDITSTATENDALILEQKLINKLKPKYNIIFRDDRSYPFIGLSKHKFPKIHITREKSQYFKSEHLYGPYSRREEANKNIEFVQKIFKLRTCTDNELSHRSRACMLHSIGKCSAPCMNKDDAKFTDEYTQNVKNARQVLSGNIKPIVAKLKEEMQINVGLLDFEAAAKNRDMMISLQGLTDMQSIYSVKGENVLVFNIYEGDRKYLGYAEVIAGVPRKIFHQEVSEELIEYSNEDLLEKYIEREMSFHGTFKIITPFKIENLFFDHKHSYLGDQEKGWLNLVASNLELVEGEAARKGQKDNLVIDLLKVIFPYNLSTLDFIDISHFGGEATYGGKIRWSLSTGALDKKGYRLAKFDNNKIDDIYHINKTVEKIYHDEKDSPSILLIDGDKPQMNAAFKALKAKGLGDKVLLMCSAKGSARIKGEENFFVHPNSLAWINPDYISGDELNIAKNNVVRLLFQNLQDNAHDFSNGARKKQMSKTRFEKTAA